MASTAEDEKDESAADVDAQRRNVVVYAGRTARRRAVRASIGGIENEIEVCRVIL